MASSNRHWPSLFKSKPCNTHHQWQHDINPSSRLSGGCQKAPYTSGCEERSPEPKPRWNPKPEQIRILEAIFNSGMVNPPRDEIRKIRAQLQEYGQVGDANVFYWFQNRKSRSKHKQRHLHSSRSHLRSANAATNYPSPPTTATSSSSDRSSVSDKIVPSVASTGEFSSDVTHIPVSMPVVVNQPCFHAPMELGGDPFFVQGPQTYCFAPQEMTGIFGSHEQGTGVCCSALWSELMGQVGCRRDEDGLAKTRTQLHHSSSVGAATGATVARVGAAVGVAGGATAAGAANSTSFPSPFGEIQGAGAAGGGSGATVFINDLAFDVVAGPFNVREAFGEAAILLHSSGHPVLTNEHGVTLQPLQHGASYYVV